MRSPLPGKKPPMNKNKNKHYKHILTGGMALAFTASGLAQEKPYTQPGTSQPPSPPPAAKPAAAASATPGETPPPPEPNAVEKLFNIKIPEAIAKGKFNLNARL